MLVVWAEDDERLKHWIAVSIGVGRTGLPSNTDVCWCDVGDCPNESTVVLCVKDYICAGFEFLHNLHIFNSCT